MEDNEKQYVTIGNLTVIVGLLIAAIGWLFLANSALSAKVDKISGDYLTIQTQLSQIQTDILWIKDTVSDKNK